MLKRLWNLIRGFFGLFVGGLEKNNPEALLENEKENLRKQISEFNVGLAGHAAMVEKLMSKHRSLVNQEAELKAKTTALVRAGQTQAASEMALRYQNVDKQEDEVRAQLEQAEVRYKELVRARDVAVKTAKDKIEKLTAGISDMKVQKAMAEMSEMAAGMVSQLGGAGDTLNRLEEQIAEQREKAAGRARVARDSVDMSGVIEKEGEQQAMADLALADFAAANGLALPVDVTVLPKEPALLGDSPMSNDLTGMMGGTRSSVTA